MHHQALTRTTYWPFLLISEMTDFDISVPGRLGSEIIGSRVIRYSLARL